MAEQMRVMNVNNARLIQLLAAANPQPPAAPSVPDVERSRHSNRSGDRSHNVSTERARGRRRAPSPSLRERSSSSESSQIRSRVRRGRSPRRGDHTEARDKSTSQKIRDLDARLDAINTGTNAPVTVDTLGCSDEVICKAFSATLKGPARSWFRKLSPGTIDSFGELSRLFVANFMSCRNRQKNASHLFTVHQKETESLKDFVKRFNQAILEVEDPSDKVIIMAMMEGLRLGPLFDSLSKNVPETLSALQSKADKYIAAEELAEAKRRLRGKDDHKRKEPDTRRNDYREETRYKRPDRDPKRSNNRRPRTPPRRPEFILPPLNAPVAQLKEQIADLIKRGYLRKYVTDRPPPNSPERRYGDNRPTAGNIQTIHGGFGLGGCSTSSRKRHARSAFRLAEEEIYNLSSPCVGDQPPITFSNNDLIGLHLPHDDALVVSAVIANFNVQRILIDSDCPLPYNTILGRPTLGGIKAITSTYHLKMKFPTLTGIGEVKGDQKMADDDTGILRGEIEQLILEDPRETENTKPLEEVALISIHPNYPDCQVMIGTELTDELRLALTDFLKKNSDVFAWSQGDVPGIDPEVAMHKLFTKPEYSPVLQKRRKFAPERLKVIEDEISKLIRANIVREAYYPDWLANVVVAPKKGGSGGYQNVSSADVEKTSFITERGLYCYKVMPFGLKNAGATYQRLVNKMFNAQIGKTMEVYIDDMLVKSLQAHNHIAHLEEAFDILRRHRMMLNPSKCIFGVSSGKFLGFLVTKRGIEVNPDQIQALIAMRSPRNIREVQQLTGRVAALNKFVSKSADKCLPFFKILRKSQTFQWSEESENAFRQLKEYLGSPPLLSVPTADEDLYVYLSASPTAISAVLVREEGKIQKPIYYVSKTLIGAEARYPRIKKIVYALMIAARKLRHYFQAHSIVVLTDQPLKQILHRPDTSGRLLKWSIELSEFHIEYKPRTAIKAQALADFIVESTHEDTQPETTPLEAGIPKEPTSEKDLAHWILFVVGSSNQHGCGAGLVIRAPSGEQIEYAIRMGFQATNNEAEYETLLAGLRIATELGAQSLEVFSDSQLVVNQVQGDYLAKDSRMIAYLGEVKVVSAKIKEFKIHQIPREDNKKTDALANLASTFEFISDRTTLEMSPTRRGGVRSTRNTRRHMRKSLRSQVAGKEDYSPRILLADHRTRCGSIYKEIRQMPEICPRQPSPSHRDGTDVQPLAIRLMGDRHSGFGVPKVIISDNARQFNNDRFRLFCSDLAISHHFSSPGHPQANGQVEVTNRTILRNLKARLERSKSEWAENLPSILWTYHTTSRIPTGETPYSMVFGTESVIPVEIGMPSFRISNFDKESNEAELRLNLDLLEEKRENAELHQMAYKCQVAKYYNLRVRHRSFLSSDLVLRKVTLPTKEPNAGKLGPTWEGPYKVVKVSRPGDLLVRRPKRKGTSTSLECRAFEKVLSINEPRDNPVAP
ncbi:hypothetical protein Acr_28g0005880 [Actinidia rufa]|uniref:Uncharacterized protein n=1 Tax=Actinidia rufa TaxID=165716 RepID=A0A7J0H9U5_9ERIC|nr:hypothetical protein Acr_28g0005880 [Actinidia rufa]